MSRLQVAAQFLSAGTSSGVARCARLTVRALAPEAEVTALAVEDREPDDIAGVSTRAYAGSRRAFVAANTLSGLSADWVIYDFAGTARAHSPLKLAGKPYAVWVHGIEVWPGNLRADYAKAIRGASAVFVNSHHTLERLSESMPGLTSAQVCLLGTEKDVDPTDNSWAQSSRTPMVLFVGRNDEMFYKGQDVLIGAWQSVAQRLPGARLCFVGGGDQLARVRELAAGSPVSGSIEVKGLVSEDELNALYRRARLFAMPSAGEGFGLVFAEAMSHGLPVLTSTEDASMEVNAHGETGYSISRSDTSGIAKAITDVLENDQLFDCLSRKAHARWESEFSFSAFRGRFLEAATRAGLIGEASAPPPQAEPRTTVRPRDRTKARADGVLAGAQGGNRSWWTLHPMSYDRKDRIAAEPYSSAWFDEVDRRFVDAARHFAHDERPFDRVIPYEAMRGRRVLEVGCGMGLHAELMSRAGAALTAIDISPKSIAATRARLDLKGLTADVRELDAERLDETEAFDFIWSWGAIHHSSRTGRVLRNLHRALKPGGQLRFMVYNLESTQAYSVMMSRYLLGFWAGRSLDELLWESADGYLARYFTRDSLADLCSTFFDDVQLQVFGLESDAVPLPSGVRQLVKPLVSDRYIADVVHRRGAFLFATATKEP